MSFKGNKNNKELYKNLLCELIPDNIKIYIEPFGGEFGLYEIMSIKPRLSIYNDIDSYLYENAKNKYSDNNFVICYNEDYKEIINKFDSIDSFFYIDPPYYKKYYYNYNFTDKDHVELSEILHNIKGRFLMSYQDKDIIRKLYTNYNIYKYKGLNPIYLPEIAITNYI